MLAELRIRNVAVIEDLEIVFEPGFNVITGETGAGKTILMRALGLLLGDRGGADLVRQGAGEAEVEALFTGPAVAAALAARETEQEACAAGGENAAEVESDAASGERTTYSEGGGAALSVGGDEAEAPASVGEATVRRVIAAAGRQRAYLNDRLVTTGSLAALGERLVHVYGQHEHHDLLLTDTQRAIVDLFGGHGDLVAAMGARFRELARIEERLRVAREGTAGLAARRELLAFQVQELARVAPLPGETEELDRERGILGHAGRLRAAAGEAEQALQAGDGAVLDLIARHATRLAGLAAIDAELGEAARLLDEARPALEEAALRLGARARAIAADPERLEAVEERLALLQRLERKHGCAAGGLGDLRIRLQRELDEIEGAGSDPGEIERQVASAAAAAWETADALSAARAAAAAKLEKRITAELRSLALGGARLGIALETIAPSAATPPAHVRGDRALAATGAERPVLLFSPNRGEQARPLGRIASGGELSRLMLALKTAAPDASRVPTLLFDEVDAGIGGAVAEAVGRKLARLAHSRQVVCITHLPQIAACADHHFVVRKRQASGRMRSSAERLSDQDRVEELARMLAGAKVTEEARRHAAELRRLGRRGER